MEDIQREFFLGVPQGHCSSVSNVRSAKSMYRFHYQTLREDALSSMHKTYAEFKNRWVFALLWCMSTRLHACMSAIGFCVS